MIVKEHIKYYGTYTLENIRVYTTDEYNPTGCKPNEYYFGNIHGNGGRGLFKSKQ